VVWPLADGLGLTEDIGGLRCERMHSMGSSKVAAQMLLWTMAQVIILAALIFIPAWTIRYWQAWVFLIVWAVCVYVIGMYLGVSDPALLERRRKWEPRPAQRAIASLEILSFNALLVVSALDHRFGWSYVPPVVSVVGDLLVGLGLFVVLLVFRANTYGGSSVEVVGGQTVTSTGPYAIVRHPMYAAFVVMALGASLALGSWWGLLAVVGLIATLVWRIFDEEKLLRDDLPGYAEYTQRVRYRLVPFVW
jgi:protein-S-isoprenylcysteine O-methyltransferase Ste14